MKVLFLVYYKSLFFRVARNLEVTIEKVKTLSAAEKSKINSKFNAAVPRTPSTKTVQKLGTEADDPAAVELLVVAVVAGVKESADLTRDRIRTENSMGVRNTTKQEWLSKLNSNFVDTVVGGMEASMRALVMKKIAEKEQLKGKENQAVINSINHYIYEYIGAQRPEKALCR